jgi:hypothetical protein
MRQAHLVLANPSNSGVITASKISILQICIPGLEIAKTGAVLAFWTMKFQHPGPGFGLVGIVIMGPATPSLPQASGAFLNPLSSLFDFAENSNF